MQKTQFQDDIYTYTSFKGGHVFLKPQRRYLNILNLDFTFSRKAGSDVDSIGVAFQLSQILSPWWAGNDNTMPESTISTSQGPNIWLLVTNQSFYS